MKAPENTITCIFCGNGYVGVRNLMRHSENCPRHPAVQKAERLRNGLRLCIGINSNRPWDAVPDVDVDGYVKAAMQEGRDDG